MTIDEIKALTESQRLGTDPETLAELRKQHGDTVVANWFYPERKRWRRLQLTGADAPKNISDAGVGRATATSGKSVKTSSAPKTISEQLKTE